MVNRLIATIEMMFLAAYLTVYLVAVAKGSNILKGYSHVVAGLAILIYALSVFLDSNTVEFMVAGIIVGVVIMVEALGEYVKKATGKG